MLNGGAHHSSVREIEPLIWPLLNCQTHCILNGQAQIVNKKIIGLGWPYEEGHRVRGSGQPRTASADSKDSICFRLVRCLICSR